MPMSAAQITAELQRKANAGQTKASSAGNQKQLDDIIAAKSKVTAGTAGTGGTAGTTKTGTTGTTGTVGGSQVTATGTPQQISTDWAAEGQKLLTQLQKINETPFSYSYQSDPSYIAAVQAAQDGAKVASKNTMETMNDRGIFNSSVTSSQLGQIQQQAEKAPLQLVPQLEANAYNRFQQGITNQSNVIQTLLSQANYQQGFQADQQWKEADVTGTLETPEMRNLLQSLSDAKTGWHSATTQAEKDQFAADGKAARAAMAALGMQNVDKLFGANVTAEQALANFGSSGMETMAAKQYREGKATADQQWKDSFGLQKDQFGLQKDQFQWQKDTWRPPSSGPSASSQLAAQKQLIGENTDTMIFEMLNDGVNSREAAIKWMNDPAHAQSVFSGGIDTGSLMNYDFSKGKGEGGSSGSTQQLTPTEVYLKAYDMATKDPEYMNARTKPERQQAILQGLIDKLNSLNNPAPAPGGNSQSNLDHKTKWLTQYTS